MDLRIQQCQSGECPAIRAANVTVIVIASSCSITQAQELTALSQVDISPLCYFISFDSLLCTPSTSLPNIQNVNPADIICVSCLRMDSAVSAAAAAAATAAAAGDLHISATESADVPSSTPSSTPSSSSLVICDVSPSTGATTSVDHMLTPPPRADALEPSMTLNNANKRIAKKTTKTKFAERKMISRCRSAPLSSSSPSASGSSISSRARRRGKLPLQASQCDDEGVASPSSSSSSPPSRTKRQRLHDDKQSNSPTNSSTMIPMTKTMTMTAVRPLHDEVAYDNVLSLSACSSCPPPSPSPSASLSASPSAVSAAAPSSASSTTSEFLPSCTHRALDQTDDGDAETIAISDSANMSHCDGDDDDGDEQIIDLTADSDNDDAADAYDDLFCSLTCATGSSCSSSASTSCAIERSALHVSAAEAAARSSICKELKMAKPNIQSLMNSLKAMGWSWEYLSMQTARKIGIPYNYCRIYRHPAFSVDNATANVTYFLKEDALVSALRAEYGIMMTTTLDDAMSVMAMTMTMTTSKSIAQDGDDDVRQRRVRRGRVTSYSPPPPHHQKKRLPPLSASSSTSANSSLSSCSSPLLSSSSSSSSCCPVLPSASATALTAAS